MLTLATLQTALTTRFAHQPTFLQALEEVLTTLTPLLQNDQMLLERFNRLLTPERVLSFKVLWTNDAGEVCHNTGYRVQFSSALGPYKGGLRFDATVSEDILKFLGFEQTFKNALTGLPLGGGKGGSDFDPKGKSDTEIRNFCRAFMVELHHHIGLDTDVPAGDMGVGGREIGYMVGMYRELTHSFNGALTGKDPLIGGSLGRTEATGHGVVYFARAMLREQGATLSQLRCVVSGSGNVAEHTARKLQEEGALVLTLSDRSGFITKEAGLTQADIDRIIAHKDTGANLETLFEPTITFTPGAPWQKVAADAYFPCATQNEVSAADATVMVRSAKLVVEGANMPLSNEAVQVLHDAHIAHAPGKASNAGGVAVSGLEMVQNASHYPWTATEVEEKLVAIMERIHDQCIAEGAEAWGIDYVKGANIAGAKRVLAAMEKLGW
jgi:glutamate dehydrogenase (NADP+)